MFSSNEISEPSELSGGFIDPAKSGKRYSSIGPSGDGGGTGEAGGGLERTRRGQDHRTECIYGDDDMVAL